MKKLFTVIRQGKLDEVKRLIEKKPELVHCVSGPLPKKDHGQSPLQVALKTGKYEIADYLIDTGGMGKLCIQDTLVRRRILRQSLIVIWCTGTRKWPGTALYGRRCMHPNRMSA